MATKKPKKPEEPKANGGAHDDPVLAALKGIHEEMQAQGARAETRLDEVTARVEARLDEVTARMDARLDEVTTEMRAIRSVLVESAMRDRTRLDNLERRVETLEAGKH